MLYEPEKDMRIMVNLKFMSFSSLGKKCCDTFQEDFEMNG